MRAGVACAAMAVLDELDWFHAERRDEWRAWLHVNAATAPGVWLVTWRKPAGKPILDYEDAVEEALAFGWIDSKANRIDDERTRLLMTPRRSGSGWAGPNKARIARLDAAGLMTPAGRAVVEKARADGSWSLLDDVERLVVPADLAAAFDAHPGSRAQWDAFPPSARKAILTWIVMAKRPATRAARVEQTAARAANGERANEPLPT